MDQTNKKCEICQPNSNDRSQDLSTATCFLNGSSKCSQDICEILDLKKIVLDDVFGLQQKINDRKKKISMYKNEIDCYEKFIKRYCNHYKVLHNEEEKSATNGENYQCDDQVNDIKKELCKNKKRSSLLSEMMEQGSHVYFDSKKKYCCETEPYNDSLYIYAANTNCPDELMPKKKHISFSALWFEPYPLTVVAFLDITCKHREFLGRIFLQVVTDHPCGHFFLTMCVGTKKASFKSTAINMLMSNETVNMGISFTDDSMPQTECSQIREGNLFLKKDVTNNSIKFCISKAYGRSDEVFGRVMSGDDIIDYVCRHVKPEDKQQDIFISNCGIILHV